jgi:hypothetical protein
MSGLVVEGVWPATAPSSRRQPCPKSLLRIAEERLSAIRHLGLVRYNERRKFKMSCTCDGLRLLKLRRTPFASEAQCERSKRS